MAQSARRIPTPPRLRTLLVVLAVLLGVWFYQNGALDSVLGALPATIRPQSSAPEREDGLQAALRSADSIPLQPSAAAVDPPPAQAMVETQALRGASGGWYQVYFSKPRYPDDATKRSGGLNDTLVADLDAARQQIDVASFDFDLADVAAALLRAQRRGVQVRVAVDGENLSAPQAAKVTGDLQAAGIRLFVDERPAFMHDKFIVIDGATVWTGSWNLTINDTFRNNNNMLRMVAPALAQNYSAKADDIFAGTGGPVGGSVLVNPVVTIGQARITTLFAPDDAITDAIVERIDQATQQVDILAFAFTSEPIAAATIRARERGVAVRIVMESRNTKGSGSVFPMLQRGGIDSRSDGNCYIMHHKVIIIDHRTVITGSFNFTNAAQQQNDENVLMIDDAGLAARYTEEFARVYQQALRPLRCG